MKKAKKASKSKKPTKKGPKNAIEEVRQRILALEERVTRLEMGPLHEDSPQ